MLRILTWNSNTGFEKMQSDDLQLVGHVAQPLISRKETPAKRKRSVDRTMLSETDKLAVKSSLDDLKKIPLPQAPVQSLPPVTSSHIVTCPTPSTELPANDLVHNGNNVNQTTESQLMCPDKVKSREEAQVATMRQTISSQLSLEILVKHRELRLIDQELAKCQIALEQLRRCSEIPYPAFHQPSDQVSNGKGPAVRKPAERHPARSPAPWGVADGPYTRHYARWLLPDPQFDGGESDLAIQTSMSSVRYHGHSTRGHFTDFAQMVGKTSRSQRALNAGLPPGYSEPKQKPTGPMILKRKSDGKMVKLVCPDCARFDFGSAQGFINHCRIGHQRNFASHDAAAEGCGEPIEVDDHGVSKIVSQDAPTPITPITPIVQTYSAPATPLTATPVPNAVVNPLVRSAHLISKDTVSKPLVKGGFIPKVARKAHSAKASVSLGPPNPEVPNLSALLEKRGMSVNLQNAVADAKTRAESPEDFGDDDMDVDSPLPTPGVNSRHPLVAGSKQPVKSSLKTGMAGKSTFSLHRHREAMNGSLSSVKTSPDETQFHHFIPLIPSPTNESTQAPSLIDDDEEMDPQSPPSSDEFNDSEVHFHIRDDDHSDEPNELRGHELPAPATACTQPAAPAPATLPGHTTFARVPSAKQNGSIQFIAEQPSSDDQNDKKRRKIGQ